MTKHTTREQKLERVLRSLLEQAEDADVTFNSTHDAWRAERTWDDTIREARALAYPSINAIEWQAIDDAALRRQGAL